MSIQSSTRRRILAPHRDILIRRWMEPGGISEKIAQMALEYGTNPTTIRRWLERYNLIGPAQYVFNRDEVIAEAKKCKFTKQLLSNLKLPSKARKALLLFCIKEQIELASLFIRTAFTPPPKIGVTSRSDAHRVGNLALARVKAIAVELGCSNYTPEGDGDKADFIVDFPGAEKALRIQVKSVLRRSMGEALVLRLTSQTNNEHYSDGIEYVVGYDFETNTAVAVDPKKFRQADVSLYWGDDVPPNRFAAKDYLFENVLAARMKEARQVIAAPSTRSDADTSA